MSKSLILGNGNILVGFDARAQVRDFYFPYVGLENHVGGHYVHRLGVWVDGVLHWLSDPAWTITIDPENNALVGLTEAVNEVLGISLSLTDAVYNEKNILIRRVMVRNTSDRHRQIRLFFAQEFEIYESHRGDTAYFDPIHHVVVHYKGRRVFLVNATKRHVGFDDFSTGVFNIEGKEGTFRDAEDGVLSKNPIEHGHTDSVIGLSLDLAAGAEESVTYWVAVAESIKEALDLNRYVLDKTPEHMLRTTHDFWKAWVAKYNFSFYNLSEEMITLFNKSLFYIRAHVDAGGAIIASSDTDMFQGGKDTYGYMWPRDASFAATALDRAGDPNVAKRFFEFCNEVITEDGYFMHKYRPDKSLGSSWHPWISEGRVQLPIQEDETALVLVALWKHYELSRDIEFIESIYNSLIKRSATFLMGHRDAKTALPKSSYDLWEEKFGIHTFTAASVYGALIAASKFAGVLGKTISEHNYLNAASDIKGAIMKYLYDDGSGMFYKTVRREGDEFIIDRTADMSSVWGVVGFGVLSADDPRITRAIKGALEHLGLKTSVGGVARYQGDRYYQVDPNTPGNPWIITTLWLADYYIRAAKKEADLEQVRTLLGWVVSRASRSGILSEQIHPYTGEQISAAPLVWSHAAYVNTVISYLDKLEEFGVCKACNPVH